MKLLDCSDNEFIASFLFIFYLFIVILCHAHYTLGNSHETK
jgi:hypothetical protein